MTQNNFHYAQVLLSTIYGIELEDDDLNSHYIKVIKLNEAAFSNLTLMDISLTNVTQVAYDKGHKGIMEFYGDSITCGYGILGKTSDGFTMDSEDATKTYAYLASEALGYEPSLVSQSGISLAMNVFDSNQYFKDIYDTVDTYLRLLDMDNEPWHRRERTRWHLQRRQEQRTDV